MKNELAIKINELIIQRKEYDSIHSGIAKITIIYGDFTWKTEIKDFLMDLEDLPPHDELVDDREC